LRVRTEGKNLEQIGVRAEVETREDASLLFQIVLESLLAEVKLFLEPIERAQQ
jgi:hypothetical protein